MGILGALAVSRAGLDVERTRVEVAMRNLANANTVAVQGGPAFVPMRVVAFAASTAAEEDLPVPRALIQPATTAERRVFDPGHAQADANGFVRFPAVDSATEMMEMTRAYRAYEANVVALQTARSLILKSLEIGGGM